MRFLFTLNNKEVFLYLDIILCLFFIFVIMYCNKPLYYSHSYTITMSCFHSSVSPPDFSISDIHIYINKGSLPTLHFSCKQFSIHFYNVIVIIIIFIFSFHISNTVQRPHSWGSDCERRWNWLFLRWGFYSSVYIFWTYRKIFQIVVFTILCSFSSLSPFDFELLFIFSKFDHFKTCFLLLSQHHCNSASFCLLDKRIWK